MDSLDNLYPYLCHKCAYVNCATVRQNMKICSGCRRVSYCSMSCQAMDWLLGHKERCLTTPITGEQRTLEARDKWACVGQVGREDDPSSRSNGFFLLAPFLPPADRVTWHAVTSTSPLWTAQDREQLDIIMRESDAGKRCGVPLLYVHPNRETKSWMVLRDSTMLDTDALSATD